MGDSIVLDPFTSVDLGTYTIDGTIAGINETTSVSSDLGSTTTPFDWSALATGAMNLLNSWGKVAIAGQAQQNALPGQEIGASVQIAQSQAQQSTNLMIGVGIIAGVALISVVLLSK